MLTHHAVCAVNNLLHVCEVHFGERRSKEQIFRDVMRYNKPHNPYEALDALILMMKEMMLPVEATVHRDVPSKCIKEFLPDFGTVVIETPDHTLVCYWANGRLVHIDPAYNGFVKNLPTDPLPDWVKVIAYITYEKVK